MTNSVMYDAHEDNYYHNEMIKLWAKNVEGKKRVIRRHQRELRDLEFKLYWEIISK